ncbi:MAG: hypothetical protein GY847_36320 [Proteobacteria bacterium]|nr:hypothetical protein [Pseudomonadota bacterium]
MRGWKLLMLILFLGSILGGPSRCGNKETIHKATENGPACTSGESRSCTCPGDKWGVQYCVTDGSGWNNCNCSSELIEFERRDYRAFDNRFRAE